MPIRKLTPVRNQAERSLRDNGLVGRSFLVFGAITLTPSLIARGIRLERESREDT